MISKTSNPFSQSGTSRRAAAALLLSIALALTCATPSHARTGWNDTSVESVGGATPGGFFHFLLRIIGCVGGVLDPNGQH